MDRSDNRWYYFDAPRRKIAGIDLGTTYSAIAHFDEYGKVDVIPNSDNERITPSVILFEEDEVIVGKIATRATVIRTLKEILPPIDAQRRNMVGYTM